MLRALLIFMLGTKYAHPLTETGPRLSQSRGHSARRTTQRRTLCLFARPHTQALRCPVRLQGLRPRPCSALPPSCARPSSSAGSRKTRSEPAQAGGACSVAGRFGLLVGSSSATPVVAAAAAAERPEFPAAISGPSPPLPDPGPGPVSAPSRAPRSSPPRASGRHRPGPSTRRRSVGQAVPGSAAPAAGGGGRPGAERGAPGRWCGMPPPPPGCVGSRRPARVSGGCPATGLAPQPPRQR